MEAKLFVFAAVAISEVFSACKPSSTKFENFQKTPKRSIQFAIRAVSKKCPGLNEFYYDWKVQELPKHKVLKTSSDPSLTIEGYSFNSSNCFIVDYLVTVRISHYPDMAYADGAGEVFHFAPDTMHIEILGGSEKTHLFGQDLIVNAKELSVDLSYPPGEDAFAGNDISWRISPEIENYYPPKALIIHIPGVLLENNTNYIFMVTVTRTKIPKNRDVQHAIQVVDIIVGEGPLINILCVRNCINPHYLEVTVFSIDCIKNCEDLSFQWSLDPPTDGYNLDFGDGFDKLLILDGTYEEGDSITVGVVSGGSRFFKNFRFASGIKEGNCSIYPAMGISSITKFSVNCSGFASPYGVVIYNIYQSVHDEMILINEESYFDVSDVYLSAGDPAVLKIEVQDNAFLLASTTVEVSVSTFRPRENIELISAVKKLVLSQDSTSITSYSIEGFHNEAVQMISCLLDEIELMNMDSATVRDLHKHMAEALVRMRPGRFATAFQRMVILIKLQRHKLHDDTVTSELMGKAMVDSVLHLHKMHNHKHDKNIPQTYIDEFVMQTLNLSLGLLKQNEEILSILNTQAPIHEYDSYDEYVSQKIQIREDFKKIITNIIVALQTNCITALYNALPDEKPKLFENDLVALQTERKHLHPVQLLAFAASADNVSEVKVFVPTDLVSHLQEKHFFADIQIGVFKGNPFWWHNNATTFTTQFLLFDIFIHCDKVRNFSSPFFIEFDLLSTPSVERNGTLTKKSMAVYRVELEAHRSLVANFENVADSYTTYKVTWSECFCSDEDFASPRSKLIANSTDPTHKSLKIDNEDSGKVIFICIKKLTAEVSYKMTLTTFACLYWDLSSAEWRSHGCKVLRAGLDFSRILICECNHVSLFAGQVLIPPNSLSFNEEITFTIAFVENYAMIAFVTGLVLLWITFFVLAHYRDKSVQKRNIIHKLDDNVPGDRYPYLVVVFTGVFFDAQTTADVAFQLIGEYAKSRTHLIKCEGVELLQRNAQDWFTLYCPSYLGHLKKIKIWHNCKGKSPHWYCERVIVQDLKTGLQYCFTVKKWFSLIWGTGKIYREISIRRPISKIPEILFMTQLESDFKDKHIWMSILVRDFQSNFNSKERVSAGFCFLFLSMLANAMFYGVPLGSPTDSIDKQSKFFVGVAQIIIFIESWLVATPMGLFIVFLFKNSRPI